MAKIFVTSKISESALDLLKSVGEVEVWESEETLNGDALFEKMKDKDAVLTMVNNFVTDDMISRASNLKIIGNCGVGYNNIDIESAEKHGVIVTNTPDVLNDATADLTWALILGIARRIVEADKFVREGKFKGWLPHLFIGNMVYGKKLGIIGMGRIGTAVCERAKGFHMEVYYYNRRRLPNEKEEALNARYMDLESLLRECDYITIHAPLNEDSYHLIGRDELNLMKKDAYLINTSRGPLIDEQALYEHLKAGKIAGAALDVYEHEPEIVEGMTELDNVILLPHIGSATYETRTKMAELAANNIANVLSGKAPITPVTKMNER
ncbi:D-glycerate dehydrogenase [Ureibacillus sp. FSL K6-8385]|uniref:D-glycerate dehydrogenase n=1 Tax=Ureibacillus terrenus TaxID=118246 RepID=A0A540V1C8_9BACL|nr:D-glycerate dehydrogenase [Ureibacillus terrenus]MED3662346.1 D-glycerate dehydrogenase [Ureibacillus terrenus]MED3764516.1 D-glycerate dehydrogenase [Ureibacillus terrenus]TQE90526.1 D-glycerate dehydrogenase [Ureibacillus terrenus]